MPFGVSLAAVASASAQSPAVTQPAAFSRSNYGAPFNADERALIQRRILGDPKLAELRSDRLRVLFVTPSISAKEQPQRQANAILFDYTRGTAYRASVDLQTGGVARLEQLPGRPQPSPEEIAEAARIIAKDPVHARLIAGQRGVLDGGFVVDGPPGAAARDRFLQFQLLAPDRRRLIREIIVDLTAGKIASSITRQ
ncbi:MAG TPA: hypothetical protein VGX96_09870 [Candidatus Elarobacter sp.]|nr:hypothetical protein [Candidatus Elarobacter sp.]